METGRGRHLPRRLSLFDLDNTLIAGDSDPTSVNSSPSRIQVAPSAVTTSQ